MAKRLVTYVSLPKFSHQASSIVASNIRFLFFGRATQSLLWNWNSRKAFDGEQRGPSYVQCFLSMYSSEYVISFHHNKVILPCVSFRCLRS